MDEFQTGVEVAGEAVLQTEQSQPAEVQTGVEVQPEAGVDEKAPDANTAWEKRIASIKDKAAREAREQAEKEFSEKYKDYDVAQKAMQYVQRTYGINDTMTLKEQLELADLQERADRENLTVEELQRRQELEELKSWKNQVEQQQREEQRVSHYWSAVGEFVKDKGVGAESLNQYMIDNSLTYDPNNPEKSLNVAYKAMRAEQLEQELATAKETAVKEYLQSKTAPRVEGSGTPGITQVDTSKMDWKELRAHTLARLQAANQST